MIALWIILGILALIVLLIAAVLLLPVDVLLFLDRADGFRIRYRLLGKIYGEQAKAAGKKKPSKKKKKPNPIIEGLKRSLGLEHIGSVDKLKQSLQSKGTSATLKDTVGAVWEILDRVFWILKRCRIIRCKIAALCGGEDAPLDYGTACAVVYPLVSYLESAAALRPKAEEIIIACEDDLQETFLEFEIFARVRVVHILRALLHIIRKNVEKEIRLEK